ncbi:MAG: hypothetical protein AAF799_06180 [Myxococcota bacterium]
MASGGGPAAICIGPRAVYPPSLVLGLMVVVAASSLIASLLVRRKKHDIAVMMAVGGARSLAAGAVLGER